MWSLLVEVQELLQKYFYVLFEASCCSLFGLFKRWRNFLLKFKILVTQGDGKSNGDCSEEPENAYKATGMTTATAEVVAELADKLPRIEVLGTRLQLIIIFCRSRKKYM